MDENTSGEPPPAATSFSGSRAEKAGQKRIRLRMEDNDSPELGEAHAAVTHIGEGSGVPVNSYKTILMNEAFQMETDQVEEDESDNCGFSSEDDSYDEDLDGPVVMLSKEDKSRIRKPWQNTLIVKLLGRQISYTYLCNRIKQLWALKGHVEVVDMDNGFYCIRFGLRMDYNSVLTNGPWIVADHYLTVRRWTPGFRSEEATINSVAAWVRFPGMPLEFYDSSILRMMGDKIGRSVRIDRTTTNMIRGKFARMCVELDLTKPLVSRIFIGGRWQRIEYEGLKMLCFHCGRFGHSELECEIRRKTEEGYSEDQAERFVERGKIIEHEHENVRYGPWMIAKKRYRKPSSTKDDGNAKQMDTNADLRTNQRNKPVIGSRFSVLDADEEQQETVEVVPNSLEECNEEGVHTVAQKVQAASNKETLIVNLQASAMISNKHVAKKGTTEKRIQSQGIQIASSKNLVREKVDLSRSKTGILQDVSNRITNTALSKDFNGKVDTVHASHLRPHTNDPHSLVELRVIPNSSQHGVNATNGDNSSHMNVPVQDHGL
ncbi:hypothetical protein REPUB_Repub02eG0237700 [Reevesia pubescens]